MRRLRTGPCPVARKCLRPRMCASRYWGGITTSESFSPTASPAVQPKMTSARGFQFVMTPCSSIPITASRAISRMARVLVASRVSAASARLCSVTPAANARAIMAVTPMKACSNKSDSFWVSLAKGPNPDNVPQIAIPESSNVAVAVSRGPNRKAVHNRIGIHKKPKGYVSMVMGSTPPNTASPTSRRVTSKRPTSFT